MKKIKISVALCTYNGEKYIRDQLNSILNQSKPIDELIIFDDCSNDNTVDVTNDTLKNTSISWKLVKNEKNIGFVKNFERAICCCTGDVIFLSDQDDYWMPNKVERVICSFLSDDKCLIVISDAELVNQDLNSIGLSLWKAERLIVTSMNYNLSQIFKIILRRTGFLGCTMAFKKEVIPVALPFCKDLGHDEWILYNTVLFFSGKISIIKENLMLYRQHQQNLFGVQRLNILKRLIRFYYSINTIDVIRERNYKKFTDLEEHLRKHHKRTDEKEIKILEAKEFWLKRINFSKLSKIKAIIIILYDIINTNYFKYNNGLISALRDFLSLFIVKSMESD